MIWGCPEPSLNIGSSGQFGTTQSAPPFVPGEVKHDWADLSPSSPARVGSLPSLRSNSSTGNEAGHTPLKSSNPLRSSAARKSTSLPNLLPSQTRHQVATQNSSSRSTSPAPLVHDGYTCHGISDLSTGSQSPSVQVSLSNAENSNANASPEYGDVLPQAQPNLDEEHLGPLEHNTTETISSTSEMARDPDHKDDSIYASSKTSKPPISSDLLPRTFKRFRHGMESIPAATGVGAKRSKYPIFDGEGKTKVLPEPLPARKPRYISYQPPTLRLASFSSPALDLHPLSLSDEPRTPGVISSTSDVDALALPQRKRPKPSKPQPLSGSGADALTPRIHQPDSMELEVPESPSPPTRRLGTILGSAGTSNLPLPPSSPTPGSLRSLSYPSRPVPPPLRVLHRAIAPSSPRRSPSPTPPARDGRTAILEHRDLLRKATSILCKELLKRPGHNSTGFGIIEQEEIGLRLRALARLERLWKKGGSADANGIPDTSGSAAVGPNLFSIAGANHPGEDRERRLFSEALRDGYVLCQ